VAPDVLILRVESLLCIVVALCAAVYAILRRRRPVRITGFTLAALSLLIVSEVVGAAILEAGAPAGAMSQAASPKSAATPPAELLQPFSAAWRDVVGVSAAALKEHDRAGEDLRTGHVARATGELANCEDIAGRVVSLSPGLQGGLDDGSDLEFLAAVKRIGDGLHDGCRSARSYLDTNAVSDFDDAKARFADVVEAIVRAETLARAKYRRIGGNPDSLASFETALR
jgi:hypothetical protein